MGMLRDMGSPRPLVRMPLRACIGCSACNTRGNAHPHSFRELSCISPGCGGALSARAPHACRRQDAGHSTARLLPRLLASDEWIFHSSVQRCAVQSDWQRQWSTVRRMPPCLPCSLALLLALLVGVTTQQASIAMRRARQRGRDADAAAAATTGNFEMPWLVAASLTHFFCQGRTARSLALPCGT